MAWYTKAPCPFRWLATRYFSCPSPPSAAAHCILRWSLPEDPPMVRGKVGVCLSEDEEKSRNDLCPSMGSHEIPSQTGPQAAEASPILATTIPGLRFTFL
jgi:hypothetical protein